MKFKLCFKSPSIFTRYKQCIASLVFLNRTNRGKYNAFQIEMKPFNLKQRVFILNQHISFKMRNDKFATESSTKFCPIPHYTPEIPSYKSFIDEMQNKIAVHRCGCRMSEQKRENLIEISAS